MRITLKTLAFVLAAGTTAQFKNIGFKDIVYVNSGLITLVTNLTPNTMPMR